MPLESSIVRSIVREAEAMGWYVIKVHGGPYQTAGIPDLLCLQRGSAVWLEVKQPGKRPTEIQKRRMAELEEQGGTPCHVVTSKEEAHGRLRDHSASLGWPVQGSVPRRR
jgi:Holliday junction resolvase